MKLRKVHQRWRAQLIHRLPSKPNTQNSHTICTAGRAQEKEVLETEQPAQLYSYCTLLSCLKWDSQNEKKVRQRTLLEEIYRNFSEEEDDKVEKRRKWWWWWWQHGSFPMQMQV